MSNWQEEIEKAHVLFKEVQNCFARLLADRNALDTLLTDAKQDLELALIQRDNARIHASDELAHQRASARLKRRRKRKKRK